MLEEYFNCISLVKKCLRTMTSQCSFKNIKLVGPMFKNHYEKYYFKEVLGDENRYSQIILNFVSNAIKFSKKNGSVTVRLNLTKVTDIV